MSLKKLTNYVYGEFRAPKSGKYFPNINPTTGEVINLVPDSDIRDVVLAIKAAQNAFESYSKLSAEERAKLLNKIADTMESNEYKQRLMLADVKDMGKPAQYIESIDFPHSVKQFRLYAAMIQTISEPFYQTPGLDVYERREPIGVVGLISPWNFPLMLFCIKVSAAISVGNTCVCKPTELAPTSVLIMCEIFNKVGVPPGVINVINGYGNKAAEPIVEADEVGAISFTGGSVTGARISAVAAPKLKKLQLELGGKNPAVVFNDCYLDETVEKLLFSSFFNSGQVCCSGSRILVQKDIAKEFIKKFKAKTKETYCKFIGDPTKSCTLLGPLVSRQHFNKVKGYLNLAKKEGGKIILGGRCGGDELGLDGKLVNGNFFEPTIIVNLDSNNCRCLKEEIFGPIVTIQTFDNEKEAIKLANNVEYGLAASVWTRDIRRVSRVSQAIKCGTVWVNCYFEFNEKMAYGGYKRSGVNRENGMHSIRFFTEVKSIVSKL